MPNWKQYFNKIKTTEVVNLLKSLNRIDWILILAITAISSLPELFMRQLGLEMSNRGLGKALGPLLVTSMLSQLIASLIHPLLVRVTTPKRITIIALTALIVSSPILIKGLESRSFGWLLAFGIVNPGAGVIVILTLSLILRERLGDKQILGRSIQRALNFSSLGIAQLLFYRGSITLWLLIYTIVGGCLSIIITMLPSKEVKVDFKKESASDENKKTKNILTDPAFWVGGIASSGSFLIRYLLPNLLPFMVGKEKTGIILSTSTFTVSFAQLLMNNWVNRHRHRSAWMFLITRGSQAIGLGVALVTSGDLQIASLVVAVFAGNLHYALVDTTTYEVAKSRRLGNSIGTTTWSAMALVGGLSLSIFEFTEEGGPKDAHRAATWLMIPAAVLSVILTFLLWRQHKLPPRKEDPDPAG